MSIFYQNFFRLCAANFQQLEHRKSWSFSSEAKYTVTHITLFRFADTTSMSIPQSKDFPVRGNQLHPRVQQRSTFPRLLPQERQNYITSPRPASMALPPKLAQGVGHSTPKPQIPHRVCKHGAELAPPESRTIFSAPLRSSPRAFLAQDPRHSAKPPSLARLVQG